MPCYLFTLHGKSTWMPDHHHGYVHRTHGLQPIDKDMATAYRRNQRASAAYFTPDIQQCLIDAALRAVPFLQATAHAIANEPTHVHVMLGWSHDRSWESVRRSLRTAVSKALNDRFGRREWFA